MGSAGRGADVVGLLLSRVVLFIENVAKLVCPSLFEPVKKSRVAIISVTEREARPQKFPVMFQYAEVFINYKPDLLLYANLMWNRPNHTNGVTPELVFFESSAKSG